MHPYSIELEKKSRIKLAIPLALFSIFTFGILQSLGFISLLTFLEEKLNSIVPLVSWGFISIVLTPGIIFSFYYYLFENFLWKWRCINKIIKIPNINGKYEGKLESSYRIEGSDETPPPINVTLIVKQNFDKIRFICQFPDTKSTSESNMGALMSFEDNVAKFIFAYTNSSSDLSVESDQHTGMNTLYFNLVEASVEGTYFNGRGIRPNKGNMRLKKKIH